MEYAIAEGLDDFAEMTIDSSAVAANTAWPTDSTIILKLIDRIWRTGSDMEQYGTAGFQRHWTEQWLKKMRRENFKIVMANSARERRGHYRRFYGFARRAIEHLRGETEALQDRAEPRLMRPSRRRNFARQCRMLHRDLESAHRMVEVSRRRVEQGEHLPASEKVLSVADADAAFICKGQREPTIGYRPQVARSAMGLIGYLEVPEGNAADAPMFPGAVAGWIEATGTVPTLVSTDDGYTSAEGRRRVEAMGVETVSFGGSKGHRLLGEWEWWDEERMRARDERPAVESLVFTLKYCYRFGRLSRRGIEAVRAELWEDAIAYNFFRIVQIERRAQPEKIPRAA
jgi:IS5 family transposase